ncbi:MAG: ATP-binding cassette domain-containing protein [Lactobacillales bacterium]|nr:ATP-binding cassette domain-containing protein [Lactobacillales bacterium]
MIFASVNNYNSMLFLDYLFDFLNWKEEKTSDNLKVDTTKKYVVKLVNVSFVYPNCQKYALKNINLKFESNKLVCIVGENGSGKSTLMKLILGIYEPTSGKVLLNDKNLKDYDEAERNRLFGTAFQEVNSYYVSVDDYINFGDIDNVKDTKPYANMSLANAFIEKFQNKYQTLLSKQFDENGVVPSGGQLQKLSLARAFCSKAPIMLFDEPTAALDPLSENHICEILKILGKSYTVILISHKMCHCKLADHVVVLKDGEIIEAGNHADLLKFKNIYYEMYKVQAKNFEN